ncbi:hypothetical protein [Streptomyces cinnamoneus]|uniref:ATP-binding protein n=1 Tax=Streptomyces cinnamoneus TaxID=53446 RepID=A0A918TBB2_STRCJ|nr:hypothetical protein [Streptomyces cinnamoneus]GHC37895.1 ATP-binding protein [Streptomyces cinnamoneus]
MTMSQPYDAAAIARALVAIPGGRDAYAEAESRAPQGRHRKPPQAELLRLIGENGFRYFRNESDGEPYAVPENGPAIAVPLRAKAHSASGSLRQHLIRDYLTTYNHPPSQSALADAIAALDALACDAPESQLWLRVAPDPDDPNVTWLDLGRADGQSVRIAPGEWTLTYPDPSTGPVWRRTKLVGRLPLPVSPTGGWRAGMEAFAELLPFTEKTLPLAVAWLLAALRPSIPRPIAYLTGEQGTGKTTSGRMLVGLLDGPRTPLRQAPTNDRDLSVTATAGWTLPFDNLLSIPLKLSEFLSRVVTGSADVSRALYSDNDVSVLAFERPILLTGIDVGALKSDLSERMMPLELRPITKRRTITDLWGGYERAHPEILGAMLDLAALVWAELPQAAADLTHRPRMADFYEILYALDRVTGWSGTSTYDGAQRDLVDAVLDGDPAIVALCTWALGPSFPREGWSGTMTDLHGFLSGRVRPGEPFPRTAASLSACLNTAAPSLRQRGIYITRSKSNKNGRKYTITAET